MSDDDFLAGVDVFAPMVDALELMAEDELGELASAIVERSAAMVADELTDRVIARASAWA